MATWPAGLMQVPLQSGFGESRKDNNIRSSMGYGPDKLRRRTTVAIQNVTAAIEQLETELSILDDFYEANSSIVWEWVDFLDFTTPANYRFKAPPTYRPMGGQWWSITLNLEIIP
jgi:hypothetical protein